MPVHSERSNEIMILTLDNRPENSFNPEMIQQANIALDRIEADEAVRGVVMTGADGPYFSSGMDIPHVMGLDAAAIQQFFKELFTFFHRVFLFPKPVVGALNGHTVASALAFAMCLDYRVMPNRKAACTFPEIDVTIIPPPGCLAMVNYVVGSRLTDLAFLTGRKFDGPAALEAGMVDELVDPESILDRAVAVAAELGAKKPRIFAALKTSLRQKTADHMLAADLRFIAEEMDLTMFQNCDLSCLQSLS